LNFEALATWLQIFIALSTYSREMDWGDGRREKLLESNKWQ